MIVHFIVVLEAGIHNQDRIEVQVAELREPELAHMDTEKVDTG